MRLRLGHGGLSGGGFELKSRVRAIHSTDEQRFAIGRKGECGDHVGLVGESLQRLKVWEAPQFHGSVRRGGGEALAVGADDEVGDFGLHNLGIEHAPPMITRGVCIDVSGLDGGEYLDAGRAVSRDNLERALEQADVELRPGDAVCIHTGWGRFFMTDNDKYVAGEPGVDLPAAQWLTGQDVLAIALCVEPAGLR